jgi:hypothetical protein
MEDMKMQKILLAAAATCALALAGCNQGTTTQPTSTNMPAPEPNAAGSAQQVRPPVNSGLNVAVPPGYQNRNSTGSMGMINPPPDVQLSGPAAQQQPSTGSARMPYPSPNGQYTRPPQGQLPTPVNPQ